MRLFHYTCDHGRQQIISSSMVLRAQPPSYRGLLWFSELTEPDASALGLTSYLLKCDRTAYRVSVETDQALPWTEWAHEHKVPSTIRLALDGAPGARPRLWWVSTAEIPALSVEPTWSKK